MGERDDGRTRAMRDLRGFFAGALLAAAAAPAAAGGLLDLSGPERFPAIPCGDGGTLYRVYQGLGLGVTLLRIQPGAQRAFLRSGSDSVVVSLHDERYRSNKVASTRPGRKLMRLERGDFFYRPAGMVTGGWYVGKGTVFDALYVSFPADVPSVLPIEEGRRLVSDSRKKDGVIRASGGLGRADARRELLSRIPLPDGAGVDVAMVRLTSAADIPNLSSAAAVLFPLSGAASAGFGAASVRLAPETVYVVDPGAALRVEPVGSEPFYALLISRARDRDVPRAVSAADTATVAGVATAAPESSTATAADAHVVSPTIGKAGIQWVRIPGGTFMMGSGHGDESPVHQVAVGTFEIARTPVTVGQYRACVAAGACAPAADCAPAPTSDELPVVCVDWNQARAFSAWAGGRLPSEAEWEYAARSGGKNQRKYPWGNEDATCARAVVNSGDGKGCGRGGAWPVCSKPAGDTEQGLCDMAGNVWQWVEDWYHGSYRGAPSDGSSWESPAQYRVQRGGSWIFDPAYARTTARSADSPDLRGNYIGFRVARSSR
jgi:sulfatase modifying factor 1